MAENKIAKNIMNYYLETKLKYFALAINPQYPVIWCIVFIMYSPCFTVTEDES